MIVAAPASEIPVNHDLTPAQVKKALDTDRGRESLKEGAAKTAPVGWRFRWQDPERGASDEALIEDSIIAEPIIDPLFDAKLQKGGVKRIGARSWQVGIGKTSAITPLKALLEHVPGRICYYATDKELDRVPHASINREQAKEICDMLLDCALVREGKGRGLNRGSFDSVFRNQVLSEADPANKSALTFSFSSNNTLTVKACTALTAKDGTFLTGDGHDLHLWPHKGARSAPVMRPDEAIRLHRALSEAGVYIEDEVGFSALDERLSSMLVAYRMPGSPGLARLVVGSKVRRLPDVAIAGRQSGEMANVVLDSAAAGQLLQRAERFGVGSIMDEALRDVGRMATCQPVEDAELRPFQRDAVGLHLATQLGFVNASAVGLGKTVMTLHAWKRRAAATTGPWKGIVVGEAGLRSQWVRETARFFPDAIAVTLDAAKIKRDLPKLVERAETEQRPLVLVLSYDAMRARINDLCTYWWNDMACDEAVVLSNPSSLRSKALWQLRPHGEVAVALTGTPVDKGLDDMGRMIAWVRNDEKLFRGKRLSNEYDMSVPGEAARMHRNLGPMIFRRDRSEVKDELPDIDTETVVLDPTPQELALANSARYGLRGLFEQLQSKVDTMAAEDENNPKLQAAKQQIHDLRFSIVGGITLARMAASDPAAVAASTSFARKLLDMDDLVAPAVKHGGTKRKLVGELTHDLVGRGEAVLIFSDFETCARNLAQDLIATGVRVGLYTGKQTHKDRDQQVLDFQAGDLDVLILTSSGRKGLNIQRATVLINYDLPWKPIDLVQRIGRAVRIGSKATKLMILNIVMKGTIEERAAALMVPRAAQAIAALDTHRGKAAGTTEMGQAMMGLADATSADQADDSTQFDFARRLLEGEYDEAA